MIYKNIEPKKIRKGYLTDNSGEIVAGPVTVFGPVKIAEDTPNPIKEVRVYGKQPYAPEGQSWVAFKHIYTKYGVKII